MKCQRFLYQRNIKGLGSIMQGIKEVFTMEENKLGFGKSSVTDVLKRKGIDLKKLEEEQIRLAKQLRLKDSIDFSQADRIGACENLFLKNKIISAIVLCDSECNIIEQKYFTEVADFPYVPGFR